MGQNSNHTTNILEIFLALRSARWDALCYMGEDFEDDSTLMGLLRDYSPEYQKRVVDASKKLVQAHKEFISLIDDITTKLEEENDAAG
jgi:hypothetical protein